MIGCRTDITSRFAHAPRNPPEGRDTQAGFYAEMLRHQNVPWRIVGIAVPCREGACLPFLWIGGQLAWFGEFWVEAVSSGFREAAAQSVRREFFV